MVSLVGKYELYSADPYYIDAYLKKLGVELVLRRALSSSRPTLEITHCTDTKQWNVITTKSLLADSVSTFYEGELYQDTTYDQRKCVSIATVRSEEKIIISQLCDEGPCITVILEKVDDATVTISMSAFMAFGEEDAELIQTFKKKPVVINNIDDDDLE